MSPSINRNLCESSFDLTYLVATFLSQMTNPKKYIPNIELKWISHEDKSILDDMPCTKVKNNL
jgi:hypothetical protein